ncbi:MAG: hypothetical protein PVF52_03390 [Granulosicoccaceae bacterium]|jgi:uncharacterized low-complexity protein
MSKKTTMKPLAAALGTAFALGVAATPAAADNANPFGMTDLSHGYQQIAEAKCGGQKADKMQAEEGKCGAQQKAEKKGTEAKCGEGKCGEGKKATAKEQEAKCGAKKPEAKCGEAKCGATK